MKIKKVEIQGFRAYKLKEDGIFDFTLDGDTPSNFVAIYAPNGFGKSSFYDAVEWALTNSLERYTGEHNKKNNQIAARGTKQDQIPLKILRNKDVPEEVSTRVEVVTTRGVFPRELPKLRSNSTDLSFGVAKNKKGKEVRIFSKIILSQDAIDRFLREAKPQERYELFMHYFGDEAEALRQKVTAILNENRLTLDSLRKQRTDVKKQLKFPVDSAIFDNFNSLAADLNKDGESVSLISANFDDKTEHQLLASIIERKHALTSFLAAERQRESALLEQSSRLEELQLNLDVIVEQNPRLAKLAKGVKDSQHYQFLSAAHSKHLADWQTCTGELAELETIEKLIPAFLSDESECKRAASEQAALEKQKTGVAVELKSAQTNAKLHSDALSAADQRALALRSMLTGSSAVYAEIAVHQAGLVAQRSDLQSKIATIQVDKADHERISGELAKLSAMTLNVETLMAQDTGHPALPAHRLSEVYSAHQELDLLQRHDVAIRSTQVALTRQKEAVERIVSQGLTYLAEWPSDRCPLCRAVHSSPGALTSTIKENDLLTETARQNAVQLEQIAFRVTVLKGVIESAVAEARDRHGKKVIETRTQLDQLTSRISTAERESDSLAASINATEETIQALQLRVWSLNSEELYAQAGAEFDKLSSTRTSQVAQLEAANNTVASLQAQVQKIDARLEVLRFLVESITSKDQYKKVVVFALEKAVRDFKGLPTHCSQKCDQLARSISEIAGQLEGLSAECHKLHQEMLAEGNWIDFQLLASQRDSASKLVSNATFVVESFLANLGRLLGKDIDANPELMRSEIASAMQTSAEQSAYLLAKIDKFELLTEQLKAFKPYLGSLVLRESLSDIERKISEHQLVDKKLSEEREIIFAELRERIGAFFFTDLINAIYSKIDPHPSFKKVEFIPDFDGSNQPGLNIVLRDDAGGLISPMLYFSAAQLNILSLSVFLANALHARDEKGNPLDVILIDDPIQSMDSINVLATIDLLRNVSLRFDKQIIISTHDENFFDLLKLKIPTEVFGSKFLQLESFGVVSQEQDAHDFVAGLPKVASHSNPDRQG
ncbi:exonuclease SbcC [Azotobacter beijerinckii]|uniref:Exonuclease SbcC n=1 Tax=Azotobacter beijerinckii TaxID=170623 RepID=A0A1H9K2K0_9GAMM|nr:AAA family ATPase [Azotobacter beijerinckii]SEQ93481.1 exonuclease SbcC [Azotobacter beijerinckii]